MIYKNILISLHELKVFLIKFRSRQAKKTLKLNLPNFVIPVLCKHSFTFVHTRRVHILTKAGYTPGWIARSVFKHLWVQYPAPVLFTPGPIEPRTSRTCFIFIWSCLFSGFPFLIFFDSLDYSHVDEMAWKHFFLRLYFNFQSTWRFLCVFLCVTCLFSYSFFSLFLKKKFQWETDCSNHRLPPQYHHSCPSSD